MLKMEEDWRGEGSEIKIARNTLEKYIIIVSVAGSM